MTAHDSVRAIVNDLFAHAGVERHALKHLDTKQHGAHARLSLGKDSAIAAPGLPGRARFALDHVTVRAGQSLELDVPASQGGDLVANRLEIEPDGELIIAEGSRFAVGDLIFGERSQLTIKLRNGKNGLDGTEKYSSTPGGSAPAISNLPFLAASIAGTFTLKLTGGNGGNGGNGGPYGNGADGGNGCNVGAITILYGTRTAPGEVRLHVDGLQGGTGGTRGEGGMRAGKPGQSGTAALPILKQMVEPKPAQPATIKHNADVAKRPIFDKPSDDYENASVGLVKQSPLIIRDRQGNVVWNLEQYDFLTPGHDAPDTVNPSLWRNGQLNTYNGLFEITKDEKTGWRVFQARGLDLAVVTFVECATSILVVDPLTTLQTARAAWNLMKEVIPDKPILTMIYSHSHVDHDGGVGGMINVVDTQGDDPLVKVVAPIGFMEEATSENVYAGNAMSRRASYMYGNILPVGPRGQVGAGLGLAVSTGTVTLIAPNEDVDVDETRTYDGVQVTFQLTPGSEAPAEMNMYFPQFKLLHIAENCTHTLHNILTLRGAKVRDALAWANYLTESIELFGQELEVMIAAHHWPTWGNKQALAMLENQRDMYKYLNDQVLQKLNQGYTITEIGNMMHLPPLLAHEWYDQGYYGTVNHNSKAVYQRYIGWFDGVPANLHPLDPTENGKKYVEYIGAENLMTRARADFAAGNYRWVASVVNQLVFADPNNEAAKNLLADAYEQMGYQATSAPWRNFYLGGAQELRNGVAILSNPNAGSADVLRAMSTAEFLTYVCILVDVEKAALFPLGLVVRLELTEEAPYDAESYVLRLKNGVLVFEQTEKYRGAAVQAVITTTRAQLNRVISGEIDFATGINEGVIAISGPEPEVAPRLAYCLIPGFNPWFNIVTP
ncbi:MAG TPA: alkyl sulfatase dimerization domain-containing protein [Rhizomicrobium sp.]|jgi:alkyl sulfatase BDS1-like metallo-beta-lactamase superfamily hydrolase|nr:alkyl sulfatase dimerization domain-containing protein [Rhizomicrobium sp.]